MSRILVIDDEPVLRLTLRYLLEQEGHQVWDAENGRVGVDICRSEHPDLVITDIVMPGEDGIQLARQLRAQQPALNVILISGHTDQEVLRRLAECSDMTFLEKPFTSAALLDCLRRPPEKQN